MRTDAIIETLTRAGHEAYYVGGCVRDTLLGREIHDWDIATSARPEQVLALFDHCVPTGIRHGTVTVFCGDASAEVTTYRCDGAYHDGRHPDAVRFVRTLREDLARRDFTINAMAMDLNGRITDPFGGRDDLAHGVIRCVGGADTRFQEDALRMLRAYRFSAQLGFRLEAETAAAAARCAALAAALSRERVRDEAEKTLLSPRPEIFGVLMRLGLLRACGLAGAEDFSRLAVFPAVPEARWTGVKLACPAFDPAAFRLPAKLCRLIALTAETWREGRTESEWKRLIALHGLQTARLQAAMQHSDAVEAIVRSGDCVTLHDLAVTGADFPQLRGKAVGRTLQALLFYVLDHPEGNTRAALLAHAAALRAESENNS